MPTPTAVASAADRLWRAWWDGVACAPVRELIGADDLATAYAVQHRNEERMIAGGDAVVGRKAGLTSQAVQRQLGVDQPDFGPLFTSRWVADGGTVDLAPLIAPRVEAEIALILQAPLPDPHSTREDLIAATAYAAPALEIIDSRVRGWDIAITDTVADFASGAAFIVGETRRPLPELDLVGVPMSLRVDDEEVSCGAGVACLGDPLAAALWLARTVAAHGAPLQAGDVVLTGALGPVVELTPGRRLEADLGPLGMVTCTTTGRTG